jgi:hypothetical protein
MTDFPERISISPVHRQKRRDDFYLVDRDAFPGKGVEYVRADLLTASQARVAELEAALEPFAEIAKGRAADAPEWGPFDSVSVQVSITALRAARAALRTEGET